MWELQTTTKFDADAKCYAKKRPFELAAVLSNLDRYVEMLEKSQNSRCVQAGFLHPEPGGVLAIDQKGRKEKLQQTRLYTFASDKQKIVYLIAIGNKQSQANDIQFAKRFAQQMNHDEC